MLSIFNDYIRASRYERIEGIGKEREIAIWKEGIKNLLSVKRNDSSINTKVGIKYLLTPNNRDHFIEIVKADLGDNDLSNVDHVRFRADRRMDKATITLIEQQIYYTIKYTRSMISPDVISLALSNYVYPRNFRCWISPMNVVIAPDGAVYLCCNYLYDKSRKCIGNVSTNNFVDIWNSPRHQEIRRNIRRINCDRDEYCNCRYAEIQEKYERIALTAGF